MKNSQNVKNFIWNAVGTGINCVMSFVYVVFLTRVNGIDTAGVFSVCFSVSIILFTFSNLGNRVFEVSDTKTPDSLYFTLKIFACALSLVFAAAYALICRFDAVKLFVVMALTVVRCVESLSDTLYAVFQKHERLDLAGISYVLKNAVTFGVFAAADIITGSLAISVFSMIFVTVAVYFLFDRRLCRKFEKVGICGTDGIKELIKSISYFVGFNLVIIVIANVPRLIADFEYTSAQMGFFTVIMMIPTVMSMLGQFVIQPALNGLTASFHEKNFNVFKKTVNGIMAVLVGCAVVCAAAAYFLGPPVLGFIMNIDLKDYAVTMVIAIMAGMFSIFATLISNLLTVMRHTSKQLIIYLVTLAAEIVLIYLGVVSGDFTAVFLCYLAVMVIEFVIFLIYYAVVFNSEQKNRADLDIRC